MLCQKIIRKQQQRTIMPPLQNSMASSHRPSALQALAPLYSQTVFESILFERAMYTWVWRDYN